MENLYAVWSYSSYPYYLCAPIIRFGSNGQVYPRGYEGYAFTPVRILNEEDGAEFVKRLKLLASEYAAAKKNFDQVYEVKANMALNQFLNG